MLKTKTLMLLAAVSLFGVAAYAQDPARDVQDLVGARASGGESQLRSRGYVFVKTSKGDDRTWSNWWNNRRGQCITVVTMDGRYDSIVTSPAFDCNRSGNNNGGINNPQNAPLWAQGTWYWTGGDRVMTINRDGSVSVRMEGSTYDGYYRGGRIYVNNDVATLIRNGNQIRTYNLATRVTSSYTRNPSDGGPVFGGGSSSATWEGSVDDRANIVIQGSRIYTRNISGNGITTLRQNINGSLPRRAVTVQVNKRDGRGTVRVLQQPSRSNNYSAIIQIYDSRGGRDNYDIEVTWSGDGGSAWQNSDKVNLDDLVGVRASSGEQQMRSRGFQNVDGFKSGTTSYTIWWRSRSGQCIQVATADGRYDSVTDIQTHPKCN